MKKPWGTCREVTALVSAREDRDLSLGERTVLRFHAFICGRCQRWEESLYAPEHARLKTIAIDGRSRDDPRCGAAEARTGYRGFRRSHIASSRRRNPSPPAAGSPHHSLQLPA